MFPNVGSVGLEKKKPKKKKQNTRSLGIGGPGTPGRMTLSHIWINKMHNIL